MRRRPRRTRNSGRWTTAVGVLLLVIGIGVALLGAATLGYHGWVLVRGRTAVATVVDRITRPARRGPIFVPILEFQAEDGRTVRVKSSLASRGESFEIGARVEVTYLPGAPERADVTDPRRQWFGGGVIVMVGGFITLLGWGLALKRSDMAIRAI